MFEAVTTQRAATAKERSNRHWLSRTIDFESILAFASFPPRIAPFGRGTFTFVAKRELRDNF